MFNLFNCILHVIYVKLTDLLKHKSDKNFGLCGFAWIILHKSSTNWTSIIILWWSGNMEWSSVKQNYAKHKNKHKYNSWKTTCLHQNFQDKFVYINRFKKLMCLKMLLSLVSGYTNTNSFVCYVAPRSFTEIHNCFSENVNRSGYQIIYCIQQIIFSYQLSKV